MKLKAIFQIFLIVASIFAVIQPQPVEAQEQKVCCAETTTGEHCQYTEQTKCKAGTLQAATSCDQTSFCKLGCGFDSDNGRCFKNTPKASCQSRGDCTWTESSSCDIPQCQRGCCALNNQCSFVTQLQCKKITSQFEDLNMTFDETVADEVSCVNECRSFERGACVQADGGCQFTTRNACNAQIKAELNVTGIKVGFHPDRLCSNEQLGTECAPQQYTGCLPDQDGVYWFDSCGNPENVYDSDKRTSYNDGFILSKEESCGAGNNNINSKTCGNCNFLSGTLCGEAPRSVDPKFGDFTCLDLSCQKIIDSPTSPSSGTPKKLGESWCAYDGTPGFGRDFVGSRHYRRLCMNGVELTEPCKDFREEICVQGVQGKLPLNTQESFELGRGDYVEAICRPNRHTTCTESENQYDCQNLQSRDCYWVGESVEVDDVGSSKTDKELALKQAMRKNIYGKCVPLVSPGTTFWPGESTTQTSALDPKATCEVGNQECKVTFQKAGLAGDLLDGDTWSGKNNEWKCVSNCECLEKDYLKSTNNFCKSLGDCGAWYNIEGEFTDDGFVEDSEGEDGEGLDLLESDVESYDDLINLNEAKSDYDSKFNAFLAQSAPGLIIVGATAVGAFLWGTTAFGFQAGLLLGGQGTAALVQGIGSIGTPGYLTPFNALATNTFPAMILEAGATQTFSGAAANTLIGTQSKAIATEITKQGITDIYSKKALDIASQKLTGAGTEYGAKQVTVTAAKGGGYEVTVEAGTEGIASGTGTTSGTWLTAINTIAWIYTIYTLLDVFLSDTEDRTITISCEPWVAPTGGKDCGKCNEEGKECSEYRCKSLGQMCKLLNPGTKKEACVSTHPNDATSPIITADKEALEKGYTLTEVKGSGFRLNEKIEPFTSVKLGIKTNEFAQCKFSLEHSAPFDKMANNFGDANFAMNHSMQFALPSILAKDEALKLTNGGQYTLYLKCQDGNGNQNDKPYYVKFGIKPGPDFTPPVIEATSIANGAYTPAGINETSLTVFVNEPSECKWSDIDESFEKMANDFACKNSKLPTSSIYYGLYECFGTLDNIQSNKLNNYYFRCKDKENNFNAESYEFNLKGTLPLEITSVTPEPKTKFFIDNPLLKVITARGAQGGVAQCGYSFVDNKIGNAIEFLKTNSSVHEQQFENLLPGTYETFVTCKDVAGNLAQDETSFTVELDERGPIITKLYTEGNILHLSTNELSTCEFSTKGSFKYGEGTPMTGEQTLDHETTLDSSVYYLVCRDAFDNDASYKVFV